MNWKGVIRDVTPPVLLRAAAKVRRMVGRRATPDRRFDYGVEQDAEFYDATFDQADHWKIHYTASHYYPVWTVLADRVRGLSAARVLDIGCGPGQVACLMRDIGVAQYKGLDFSTKRVMRAREACPQFEFIAADVFEADLLEEWNYDCVLVLEFLEHVNRDLDVLRRIRSGTTILATVPNFPAAGHVRHFNSATEVEQRYQPLLGELSVTPILANDRGKTYYFIQGRRRGD